MSQLDLAPVDTPVPVSPDQQHASHSSTKGGHRPQRSTWKMPLKSSVRRRVPVLLQMSAVECGAACLAMILTYYGRQTSILEIREQCGAGRDGLSALALITAAC